jgi:creatinine amidohydrolase
LKRIGLAIGAAGLWGAGAAGATEARPAEAERASGRELSKAVQMEFMRPGQIEAAGKKFPVVYIPFGLIEWHGPHLPVGTDALKAHGILVRCAERYGGVVFPPVYFHSWWKRAEFTVVLSQLFARLKKAGFRVIMGVSGHDVKVQLAMITEALEPVTADGEVAGIALHEAGWHSADQETSTDHAAKWETADMMYLYPELVDMGTLGEGEIDLEGKPPWGITGLDPREHASVEEGRRNVERAADAIGKKAQELLGSLPPEKRGFSRESLVFNAWHFI